MAVETVWDAANVAMGVGSFMANVAAGNVGGAALDAVGIIADSAATVIPCIPGGAGTAIKLLRGADKAADLLKAADKANDIRKAADKANDVRRASDKGSDLGKTGDRLNDTGSEAGQKTAKETVTQTEKLRRIAVDKAWKQEKELIERTGEGTRRWSQNEKQELLKRGKVKGFEGHHVNSVKGHPEMAGDPDNIKFLKGRKNHLEEHGGNFRNATQGAKLDRTRRLDKARNVQDEKID